MSLYYSVYFGNYGFENDVTGISAYNGGRWFSPNIMARPISRTYFDQFMDKDCLSAWKETYPKMMSEFTSVFHSDKVEQNDVIEIVYLK